MVNIHLDFTGMSGCVSFSVSNPDSSTMFGSTRVCSGGYTTGALSLSQTGTYTISVQPSLSDGLSTSGTGTTSGYVN